MLGGLFGGSSDSDSDESTSVEALSGATEVESEHGYSYVTHISINGHIPPIRMRQQSKRGIAHQLWPAASFLCNYLEENVSSLFPDPDVSKVDVLELGAGIGLVGLFASRLGFRRVLLSDLEEAVETLQCNIALNSLEGKVHSSELAWGNEEHIIRALHMFTSDHFAPLDPVSTESECLSFENFHCPNAPLVLCADCVYWESLFEPFHFTISHLVSKGSVVLISHVKRWKKDGKFFQMCKKNMNVEQVVEVVDMVPEEDGSLRRRVRRIYKISGKSSHTLSS